MKVFKIESGIPIPEKRTGKWKSLALAMKRGDSVLLENAKQVASLRQAMISLEYGVRTAKQYPSGIRVWRSDG